MNVKQVKTILQGNRFLKAPQDDDSLGAPSPSFDLIDPSKPYGKYQPGQRPKMVPDQPVRDITDQVENTPFKDAERNYTNAVAAPVEKQPLWKQALWLSMEAAKRIANPEFNAQPVQFLGQAKHDYNVSRAGQIYAPLQKQRESQLADQYKQAQIQNIPADNEYQRQVLKDREDKRKEDKVSSALNRVSRLKWFDPNNSVHAQLAKEAGLEPDELSGWDDRNPITKQVGDTIYTFNRDSGQFEPSNLPKDESKSLVPYDVVMPNGEKRTYNVPQKDAARFAQQMNIVGARIDAQSKLADKNNQARAERSELKNSQPDAKQQIQAETRRLGKLKVVSNATNAFIRAYQKANEDRMPPQEEIDKFLMDNGLKDAPADKSLLRKSH